MVTGIPKIVEKTWGRELWLANNEEEDYCSKILEINEGGGTHVHFHMLKHETFYVLSGTLYLRLIDTSNAKCKEHEVKEGSTIEIARGVPHKLMARKGNVRLIETSTYHRDEDSYRVFK